MRVFVDDMFRLHDGFVRSPARRDEVARRLGICANCPSREGLYCAAQADQRPPLSILATRVTPQCPLQRWDTRGALSLGHCRANTSEIRNTSSPTRPIRVAIALGDLAQGGVSRWIATLVESLDRRDDVCIAGVYVNGGFKWDGDAALRLVMRCPLFVRDAGDTPHAQRATQDTWAELVAGSDVITSALHQDGNEAPPALGMPWVWQAHGECEWTRRAYRHVVDRTTRVIVVSDACRKALTVSQPTDLVEAAIHLERLTPSADRLAARYALWNHNRDQRWDYAVAEQPWITFVGRFAFDKGIDQTIEVVQRLTEEVGPCRALFVGGGHAEVALRRQIRDSLGETAIVAPWQDSLRDVMAAADVLTCFSPAEGAPLTVLEAVAAGVPVVGHPVGLLPELQSATPCVRVVDPGHVDAAAEAIAAYLTRPRRQRDADAWAGHAYVASRFHPSRMAEAFAQCMRAAVGHG